MNPYVGRVWSCRVAQVDARWVMLDPAPKGQRSAVESMIPLPRAEAPLDIAVDNTLDVFIFLDTHDQPLATFKRPTLLPGEVGFLEVVDSTPFGFFLSWGLSRDLLLPFKETLGPLEVGQKVAVTPYIDSSGRLAATAQLSQQLDQGEYELNERLKGLVWRTEPEIGTFVILDKHALALLPAAEPHSLTPGEIHVFRVSRVLPDGKVEVSLRGLRHEEVEQDAEKLLQYLTQPNARPLSDSSDPEWVREVMGLSKKAVKRAAGRLMKLDKLHLDGKGNYRLGPDPELAVERAAEARHAERTARGGQRPLTRKPETSTAPPQPRRRELTGWEEPTPGFDRPARQENRNFSERPARQQDRDYSDRPARQESRNFSERPAPRENRDYSERPARQENRNFSERPAPRENRDYSERPPRRENREFSERPARQENRDYSERPPRRENRDYSERPARQENRDYSERPPRRENREFSDRPPRRENREYSERPARREHPYAPSPAKPPRREFVPDAPRFRKKEEDDT
ncbi:MAG: S1-like domain-containing RNA-binding protein [Myxococcota bacterium]